MCKCLYLYENIHHLKQNRQKSKNVHQLPHYLLVGPKSHMSTPWPSMGVFQVIVSNKIGGIFTINNRISVLWLIL